MKLNEQRFRSAQNSWLPKDGSFCNHGSDCVRIHVRGRPSVFKIPFAQFLGVSPDSDRSSSVRNALCQTRISFDFTLDIYLFQLKGVCITIVLKFQLSNCLFTHKKVLMSAVSCRPVRRRSLPSPYAAMCSLCLSPNFSIAFLITS